jgi:type II secretory pathway pseudopilin PulG
MKSSVFMRKKGGLTLVEVLVSVTVAAAILAALSAPMAVGIINRRQGQDITQATNLAQMEIEGIRNKWQNPKLIDAAPSQVATLTEGQQGYDNNTIDVVWNQSQAATPCVPPATLPAPTTVTAEITTDSPSDAAVKQLSDQANIPPNSASITTNLRNIPIDADNNCVQDYWGQVMVSNVAGENPSAGGAAATASGAKRVIVRIFRRQSNLAALNYVPVNARTSLYNSSGIQRDAAGVSFLDLPVVVLVADIARS